MTKYIYKLCMKCNKEQSLDSGKCTCGSRSFLCSNDKDAISINSKGDFICQCNHQSWENEMHIDYKDKFVNSYRCQHCDSVVFIEKYR